MPGRLGEQQTVAAKQRYFGLVTGRMDTDTTSNARQHYTPLPLQVVPGSASRPPTRASLSEALFLEEPFMNSVRQANDCVQLNNMRYIDKKILSRSI